MPRRTLWSLLVLAVVIGSLPVSSALAARNRAPRIMRAVMVDKDGNGLADRVVLTYSEKIKHKLDTSRFPFVVQGYRIKKINAARGSLRLTIMLHENANAPKKPTSIKYTRTRRQPVVDLNRLQAQKQLLTKNIIGLAVTPPPAEEFTLTVAVPAADTDGKGKVTSSDSKINCPGTCSATYTSGSSVTLTAVPDAETKAKFGGWEGCTSSDATSCTVTMDADKSVTATFTKVGQFGLQVLKNGTGTGVVTSTSTPTQSGQINCGATCTASYPEQTPPVVVTLKAVPDAATKATIGGWSGGGCSGTGDTCNVVMDKAQQVTVTFNKPVAQKMTVTKAGDGQGTVTSSSDPAQPTQVDCGPVCAVDYPKGSSVTLTATAADGSTFAGWSGDATCGTNASCTIPMDSAKNVTATFNLVGTPPPPATFALAVTVTGGTGNVATADLKINCGALGTDCNETYAAGTVVNLVAVPVLPSNKVTWTGCGSVSADGLTCVVTMSEARAVSAVFSTQL